jgi:hypothetical protein
MFRPSPSGMSSDQGAPLAAVLRGSPGRHMGIVAVAALVVALGGLTACGGSSMPQPAPPATATPQPMATATPAPTVLFNDPLTSNVNGWHEGNGCSFKSVGYHINGAVACFAPVSTPADEDVSVQASQISGSLQHGYGLLVRASVSNNSLNDYAFVIVGVGAWAFFKDAGSTSTMIVPFTASSAIHTGLNATNTLEMRMQGAHFDFLINGMPVGQADDSTFAAGATGLGGGDGIEVVYTNFKITLPSGTAYKPAGSSSHLPGTYFPLPASLGWSAIE